MDALLIDIIASDPKLLYLCSTYHISNLIDIDECSLGVASCAENAECLDTDGSYECLCSSGYTGNGTSCTCEYSLHMLFCFESFRVKYVLLMLHIVGMVYLLSRHYGSLSIDTHMCSEDTASCDENADCVNTEGGYECVCGTGYIGDGFSCISELHDDMTLAQ